MFNNKSFKDWKQDYNSGLLEKKGEIESLLRAKYGKEFEVYAHISQIGCIIHDKWGVLSPEQKRFTVYGRQMDTYRYLDSYNSVLLYDQIHSRVEKLLGEMFTSAEFVLKINSLGYCDAEDGEFKLEVVVVVELGEITPAALAPKAENLIRALSTENIAVVTQWNYTVGGVRHCTLKLLGDDNIITERECGAQTSPPVRELRHDELEWLCTVVYLDELVENRGLVNLGQILQYVRDVSMPAIPELKSFPGEMTREQWLDVINKVLANPLMCSLSITHCIDVSEINHQEYPDIYIGHRAVCFSDNDGNAYIVFRGTGSDLEWYDNGVAMMQSDSQQQQAALRFVQEVAKDNPTSITVTGHSKGGNKAQYVFITADEGVVKRCVSFDGQGFSTEFLEKYEARVEKRAPKIEYLAEQRDFVNCLGNIIGDTKYFDGWRNLPQPDLPNGYGLPYFHCPDALYTKDGSFKEYGEIGKVSLVVNRFVLEVLDNPRYADVKETTILSVMSLLMVDRKNTNQQIADAMLVVAEVLCDLIANSEQFRTDVTDLFSVEERMILATFDLVDPKKPDSLVLESELPIVALFFEEISLRYFRDKEFAANLKKTIQFFVPLISGIFSEDIGRGMTKFFGNMLAELSKKAIYYTTSKVIAQHTENAKSAWESWRDSLYSKHSKAKEQELVDTLR